MPWAESPEKTVNEDLYHHLFPLNEKELKLTVSMCVNPLSKWRSCMSAQPVTMEDWEVVRACDDMLTTLRKCSERVVADANVKSKVVETREARFLLPHGA